MGRPRTALAIAVTVVAAAALWSGVHAAPAAALDNGLGRTPPMAWNSWVPFGQSIDEDLIKREADAMVSSSMKAAGYDYLVVDGGWRAPQRDADGNLQIDRSKFPSGMKALADYVHARGLKFGLHLPVGMTDCAGKTPGTQSAPGGAAQDARRLAQWGVDYVKFDACRIQYPAGMDAAQRAAFKWNLYVQMRDALAATGRPIFYSTNGLALKGPDGTPWSDVANMRRIAGDIEPCFDCAGLNFKLNVLEELDRDAGLGSSAGPGHWQDPDTLVMGVRTRVVGGVPVEDYYDGLTDTEARAQMSLWAVLAAPLIMSNDLTKMTASTRAIITNHDVIAVDQDRLGVQGTRVRDDGAQEVWAKPLTGGRLAVALLNRSSAPATIATSASELGLADAPAYVLRNLWTHSNTETSGRIAAAVPAHGVAMFTVENARRRQARAARPG